MTTKPAGGVLTWKKVSDMPKESILLKLLLYGNSGEGKTWTATTMPGVIVLLTEPNGLPTIRASNPDAIVIQADEQNGGLNTIRSFVRAAREGIVAKEMGGQTIVLDSMNELQRMVRDEIMEEKIAEANRQGKDPSKVMFTIGDWGTLNDRMRKMVRVFRDLPFHIVGITHADITVDEITGERHIQPQFQGRALPNEIAGYFSAVALQYRERVTDDDGKTVVKRKCLLTGPSSVITKGLPGLDAIESTNLSDWLRKMAEYDPATAPPEAPVESSDPTTPKKKSGARKRPGT